MQSKNIFMRKKKNNKISHIQDSTQHAFIKQKILTFFLFLHENLCPGYVLDFLIKPGFHKFVFIDHFSLI